MQEERRLELEAIESLKHQLEEDKVRANQVRFERISTEGRPETNRVLVGHGTVLGEVCDMFSVSHEQNNNITSCSSISAWGLVARELAPTTSRSSSGRCTHAEG